MNNYPMGLRAKSKPPITLETHLRDTENAAVQIFRLDGRWGRNWCRFFRIQDDAARDKFLLNLRVAALFHDIGKANEDFYSAVTKPGDTKQTLRHEHISALVLHLPEMRSWLSANSALDLEVITGAVLSHHIKAAAGGEYKWCQPRTLKKTVPLYLQHSEVTAILTRIAKITGLKGIPTLPSKSWGSGLVWEEAYKGGDKAARHFGRNIRDNIERRSLLLAVKAGLIVADAAASGLVREGHSIDRWINEIVHNEAIAYNGIAEAILLPRGEQIKRQKGSFKLENFQEEAAKQGDRALLLAGCGVGKTIAGWKWAEAQSRNFEIGKVIFLYPTRGTATEGFRDYVGWAPEAEAAFVTGTARYELEAMAANPSEAIADKYFQTDERLFALGFWSRRYFSATVDQFLGFMEHSYSSLCLLPVLADSAVIIDEVHSFDRKMFDSLISFLQNFNLPILCMTATLPIDRRIELEKAGLKVYPSAEDRKHLADLQAKEEHPRYRLEPVANASIAFARAVNAYRQGERLLWVVNTVDRCQTIAQKLADEFGISASEILTYHSRYRLQDRQKVHSKTVEAFAFQTQKKAAIAITTQVCEMSLDLDADILISEIAPISSLVQRFGRANRHRFIKDMEFRATLHTYLPPKVLPYKREDIEAAVAFLQELGSSEVSQKTLTEAMERHTPPERPADGNARFLEGGYFATPGSFRDTDEFSVPCILDRDLDEVAALLKSPKAYEKEKFIINVPKQWANLAKPDWLPKYLGVASWEHYHIERGFVNQEDVELG